MGGVHGQSWRFMAGHGELVGEGREGEGKGRGAGGAGAVLEVGAPWGVAALGRAAGRLLPAGLLYSCKLLREEERRKERRKRKGRKRKGKKEKNMENFPNLKISKK
jgi:hypothetical protein